MLSNDYVERRFLVFDFCFLSFKKAQINMRWHRITGWKVDKSETPCYTVLVFIRYAISQPVEFTKSVKQPVRRLLLSLHPVCSNVALSEDFGSFSVRLLFSVVLYPWNFGVCVLYVRRIMTEIWSVLLFGKHVKSWVCSSIFIGWILLTRGLKKAKAVFRPFCIHF